MRIVVCCLLLSVVASLLANELVGQDTPANRDGDFELMYHIGLGLPGMKTGASYGLRDSFDVRYDTLSLLNNPALRKEIGLDEGDYLELVDSHAEAVSELDTLTMTTAFDEEMRARFKKIFLDAESKLRGRFSETQIASLNLARARNGIEKVGIQYVALPDIANLFGISPEAAKLIGENGEKAFRDMKKEISTLRKDANRELLGEVSDANRDQLNQLISDGTKESLINSNLFLKGKVGKKKIIKLGPKLILMLRSKLIQRKLGLSATQIEKLQTLKSRDEDVIETVSEILDEDQWKKLIERAVKEALRKSGTVNLVSSGIVAEILDISEAESKRLFEAGKRINEEMVSKIERICQDRITDEFSISENAAASMSKLMARAIQKSVS